MYKLIMFDMDGLLIDSERKMWEPNMNKVFIEMGYEPNDEFLHTLMGCSKDSATHRYYEHFGNDFKLEEFYKKVYALNAESVANNEVPLKPGAKEIIAFLKENNVDFCLGTSSKRDYVTKVLKNCGILDDFKHIICSDEVKMAKPAPDIYLKCMSYYNYQPEKCLVLEDAHAGAQAALSAGAKCCLVPDLGTLYKWDYDNCFVVNSLYEAIDIIKQG